MRAFQRLFFLLVFISGLNYAQIQPETPVSEGPDLLNRLSATGLTVYSGVTDAIGWYDILLGVYTLNRQRIHLDDADKPFRVEPFGFDRSIASSVGENGRYTVGSMDHNFFPSWVIYTRLSYSLVSDLISPNDASPENYRNVFLLYKSLAYTSAITAITKTLTYRARPDLSDSKSFFSGHSSSIFAAATFLALETNDFINDWDLLQNDITAQTVLKAAAFSLYYGWAGFVAYSRMRDNKHYLSDVLLGAAVGSLISTFFYNRYVEKEETILDNISFGIRENTPTLNLNLSF
jgi:membrane-associated phospholipid phosphatase